MSVCLSVCLSVCVSGCPKCRISQTAEPIFTFFMSTDSGDLRACHGHIEILKIRIEIGPVGPKWPRLRVFCHYWPNYLADLDKWWLYEIVGNRGMSWAHWNFENPHRNWQKWSEMATSATFDLLVFLANQKIAFGLTHWPIYCREIRSEFVQPRSR